MKALPILLVFGLPSVHAAEKSSILPELSTCHKLSDQELRRQCYDKVSGYGVQSNPTTASPLPANVGGLVDEDAGAQEIQPRPTILWKVRNDGRYDGYFGEGLGSKNAELAFQRSDGKDYVLANIAVQAIFKAINDSGFQPFASARWKRIDTKDKQSDIRDLSLGMDMPLGDPRKLGLYLTPLYIHRTDIYGDTDSRLFTAHGNIVKASWVKLGGDATRNNFSVIPYFGLIHERRKPEEGKWGEWNSGYIGFEWSAQWNRVTPRLQSTVKYQYFTDFSKPSGADDRDSDYGVASISYEFTDPEDETITVRPSIFLTREVGLNPVLGADRINETTFGFGLKVN